MDRMPGDEQAALIRDLQQVVDGVRAGGNAEDLLAKVASDKSRTPDTVLRMCEAFNKAKATHYLSKTGMDARAEAFSLVDPNKVLAKAFDFEKTAAAAARKPLRIQDYSQIDFNSTPLLQKTASEEQSRKPVVEDRSVVMRQIHRYKIQKEAQETEVFSKARQAKLAAKLEFSNFSDRYRRLPEADQRRAAQNIMNKYAEDGHMLLKLAHINYNLPEPEYRRTAKAVIFPADDVHRSADLFMEKRASCLVAERLTAFFAKEAGGLMSSVINTASTAMTGRSADKMLGESDDEKPDTTMTPEFQLRRDKLRNDLNIRQLVLSDKYLQTLPKEKVEQAYNMLISMDPDLGRTETPELTPLRPLTHWIIDQDFKVTPADMKNMADIYLKNTDAQLKGQMLRKELRMGAPAPAPKNETGLNTSPSSDLVGSTASTLGAILTPPSGGSGKSKGGGGNANQNTAGMTPVVP